MVASETAPEDLTAPPPEASGEPPPLTNGRLVLLVFGALFAGLALTVAIGFLTAAVASALDGDGPSQFAGFGGIIAASLAVGTAYLLKLPARGYFAAFAAACICVLLLPLGVRFIVDWNAASNWADFLLELLPVVASIPLAIVFASALTGPLGERLGWRLPPKVWWWTLGTVAVMLVIGIGGDAVLLPWDVDYESRLQLRATHATLGGVTIVTYAVIAVLGPISQELLYRGFMMSAITEASNATVGVIASAAVFALGYAAFTEGLFLQLFVYFFVFGALLAVSAAASKSIVPAIVASAAINAWWVYDALADAPAWL